MGVKRDGWPVSLRTATILRLKKIGKMGESYDDLINRLCEHYEKTSGGD